MVVDGPNGTVLKVEDIEPWSRSGGSRVDD